MILVLAGGGFFYFQKQKSEKATSEKEEVRPEAERPTPAVVPPPAEEMPYETFQTEDEKLSLEYPSAWIRAEIKNLETVFPKELIDKYELAIPLILSDPRGAQLTLAKYHFDKSMDLDAIMDALIAELAALGTPYSETSRETVGDALIVDSQIKLGTSVARVRDLLYLIPAEPKNIVYDISLTAAEGAWAEAETVFSHVQNSVQLSR